MEKHLLNDIGKSLSAIALAGASFLPYGCVSTIQTARNNPVKKIETSEQSPSDLEAEVYELAYDLSEKVPEKFVKHNIKNGGRIYHEKALEINGACFVLNQNEDSVSERIEDWCVKHYYNGEIYVGKWNTSEYSDNEQAMMLNPKEETIHIFNQGKIILYQNVDGFWLKKTFLESDSNGGIKLISQETARGEAEKWLSLTEKIKASYPLNK